MSAREQQLFVGITSWDSAQFLGECLGALGRTLEEITHTVVVLDNESTDDSVEIARSCGAEVLVMRCSQADAMNLLIERSSARYTLLIHADTIVLADSWFSLCRDEMTQRNILVSPEDIGCGPMTRDFGAGHPESSFLFFDTSAMKDLRRWRIRSRRLGLPTRAKRVLDLYGPHVTHNLVSVLGAAGKTWTAMKVMASRRLESPRYETGRDANHWQDELAYLEYGLGNFYALNGVVTHYHNWFDRVEAHPGIRNSATTGRDNDGFPVDYVRQYSARFLNDLKSGRVFVPEHSNANSWSHDNHGG